MILLALFAFDYPSATELALQEPTVWIREELLDLDAIALQNTLRIRRYIPYTLNPEIDQCTAALQTRTSVPNHIHPDPGEEGHWVAVVLTPPEWPYQVSRVNYFLGEEELSNGVSLQADLTHTVALYLTDDGVPPASATPIAEAVITLTDTQPGYNPSTWELDTPFLLQEGESLTVAIQLNGDWPDLMSVLSCPTDALGGWWSNAVTQPFSWTELSSFGIDDTPMIEVEGYLVY